MKKLLFLFAFLPVLLMGQKKTLIVDKIVSNDSFKLRGTVVSSISTDGTFANPSDFKLATQRAVKTYVDNYVSTWSNLTQAVKDSINRYKTQTSFRGAKPNPLTTFISYMVVDTVGVDSIWFWSGTATGKYFLFASGSGGGGSPTGSAGGRLTGTYPNPTLSSTGVIPGTYTNATVTVLADGTLSGVSAGSGLSGVSTGITQYKTPNETLLMSGFFGAAKEKLGLWISSDKGKSFTSISAFDDTNGFKPIYSDPLRNVLRDPSIAKWKGQWWLAYTQTLYTSGIKTFGLAKSKDLVNWTQAANIDTKVQGTANTVTEVWAPEFFIKSDTAFVIFAADTVTCGTGSGTCFVQYYIYNTNADLSTGWSAPRRLFPGNYIDAYVEQIGDTLFCAVKNNGNAKPSIWKAKTMRGPWTVKTPEAYFTSNLFPGYEGYTIRYAKDTTWLYAEVSPQVAYVRAFSRDTCKTFSATQYISFQDGYVPNHGTVVDIDSLNTTLLALSAESAASGRQNIDLNVKSLEIQGKSGSATKATIENSEGSNYIAADANFMYVGRTKTPSDSNDMITLDNSARKVGINGVPTKDLTINGELRVTTFATTPNAVMGVNASGDVGKSTAGNGISIGSALAVKKTLDVDTIVGTNTYALESSNAAMNLILQNNEGANYLTADGNAFFLGRTNTPGAGNDIISVNNSTRVMDFKAMPTFPNPFTLSADPVRVYYADQGAGGVGAYVINDNGFLYFGRTNSPSTGNDLMRLDLNNSRLGFRIDPTAILHLPAGTATAGTAPLKFTATSAVLMTTPEANSVEVNSAGKLFYTPASTRYEIFNGLSGSATLDFPSTAAGASNDLTITVTGAVDGDVVSLGVPNASVTATGRYFAWVSATNTVTVRFSPTILAGSEDPASGPFKVTVTK